MKNILNNCHIKSKIQQYLGMTPLYFLKITYKYMHKEKKSRKDIYLNTGRSLIWDYPNWSYLCLISKSRCKTETSMQQVFSKHDSISSLPGQVCDILGNGEKVFSRLGQGLPEALLLPCVCSLEPNSSHSTNT